jgi:hypothetical protein
VKKNNNWGYELIFPMWLCEMVTICLNGLIGSLILNHSAWWSYCIELIDWLGGGWLTGVYLIVTQFGFGCMTGYLFWGFILGWACIHYLEIVDIRMGWIIIIVWFLYSIMLLEGIISILWALTSNIFYKELSSYFEFLNSFIFL